MPKHSGLNEDLVKILRENLLQPERQRGHRRSPSTISPRLSPRNSPRLLRRMLLNNNIHKQRRFTVAHTCCRESQGCCAVNLVTYTALSGSTPHFINKTIPLLGPTGLMYRFSVLMGTTA
ncbi:hypothetical protein F2P81_014039 [Scophthalmus maximus]|uniref:Uncharacterized protein n=1 Tax=Scophthalmus maximus TaxID=52904 RepID=A0A6A4SIM7_SCOMX|nr:hypothetical protein F2P81_014039 [Scophthalmus maximus]